MANGSAAKQHGAPGTDDRPASRCHRCLIDIHRATGIDLIAAASTGQVIWRNERRARLARAGRLAVLPAAERG